jgi:hypothetical protein
LTKSRRLQILSASFTNTPSGVVDGASSICSRFRSAFGSDVSSVTSAASRATVDPNATSSS